jgi:hypothetical protein
MWAATEVTMVTAEFLLRLVLVYLQLLVFSFDVFLCLDGIYVRCTRVIHFIS